MPNGMPPAADAAMVENMPPKAMNAPARIASISRRVVSSRVLPAPVRSHLFAISSGSTASMEGAAVKYVSVTASPRTQGLAYRRAGG